MTTNKKPTAAEVTSETIQQWKNQYGRIVKYTAEEKVAYFKEPDLTVMDASAAIGATNPIKSNLLIAKACFLGGDEVIITDQKYFLGLSNHLRSLITKVEGELSEL